MKHPIRRRFMYLGFQGLRALAQALPLSAAQALGRALGGLAYWLLGAQRRLTAQQLAYALESSVRAGQRRKIARRVFMNLGQNAMEWLWLPRLSKRQIQELVTSEGMDHMRQALAKGNGIILVTAHFGNWELLSLYLRSLGFEGAVLARRLRYPEYESFFIDLRGRHGIPTLARGSLQEVAKLLRANQIVGMLPDQDLDSLEGVFVDFFGHPAYTPVGPAALSLMTGAPIVLCFMIRDGRRFRLVVEPPVEAPQTTDRARAMTEITQAWSRVVERYIRQYPDHWVWMHRRWKTQPSRPTESAQGSEFRAAGTSPQPSAHHAQPILAVLLIAWFASCMTALVGCSKGKTVPPTGGEPPATAAAPADPNAAQQMSAFTLTGYAQNGSRRWELEGQGASADGSIVTVHQPKAVGYDPMRTAYLNASVAQVDQTNRHVRLEHDVTIHTSDGVWFASPVLHWIPDQDQVATDTPVRIETDHMLLRGRGLSGLTQLKHATILQDVEMVLNPSDHERQTVGPKQVTITCDGPLVFDYEKNIATFEQNVHVKDPSGDLYSDKLVAYLDPQTRTIRYAEATGRVRIHQQQNTALSERAVYEPAIGKITMLGKPSLLVYPSNASGQGAELSLGGLGAVSKSSKASNASAPQPANQP